MDIIDLHKLNLNILFHSFNPSYYADCMKKLAIKLTFIALLAFLLVRFPTFSLIYLALGLYDVMRHTRLSRDLMKRYFLSKGILTWILSPLNVLFDVLSLPFINKKIYQLSDLPADYQAEVQEIIDIAKREKITEQLQDKMGKAERGMIFFKWYGENIDTSYSVPDYHKPFKYIRTIGVSIFNSKVSTAKHFGPFRPTIRVLYNINDIESTQSYIEVGDVVNRWSENKLFIFDDTLMHRSVNETDEVRYCLFVDILRPSVVPAFFSASVYVIGQIFKNINLIFYKNWTRIP